MVRNATGTEEKFSFWKGKYSIEFFLDIFNLYPELSSFQHSKYREKRRQKALQRYLLT
jgi:hypothetical protein